MCKRLKASIRDKHIQQAGFFHAEVDVDSDRDAVRPNTAVVVKCGELSFKAYPKFTEVVRGHMQTVD